MLSVSDNLRAGYLNNLILNENQYPCRGYQGYLSHDKARFQIGNGPFFSSSVSEMFRNI